MAGTANGHADAASDRLRVCLGNDDWTPRVHGPPGGATASRPGDDGRAGAAASEGGAATLVAAAAQLRFHAFCRALGVSEQGADGWIQATRQPLALFVAWNVLTTLAVVTVLVTYIAARPASILLAHVPASIVVAHLLVQHAVRWRGGPPTAIEPWIAVVMGIGAPPLPPCLRCDALPLPAAVSLPQSCQHRNTDGSAPHTHAGIASAFSMLVAVQ